MILSLSKGHHQSLCVLSSKVSYRLLNVEDCQAGLTFLTLMGFCTSQRTNFLLFLFLFSITLVSNPLHPVLINSCLVQVHLF